MIDFVDTMSVGTVTNRDTMITNETRIAPSFISRNVEGTGEAVDAMRSVRSIVTTVTAGSAGSPVTAMTAGCAGPTMKVSAILKKMPRRVTTMRGLPVGAEPP